MDYTKEAKTAAEYWLGIISNPVGYNFITDPDNYEIDSKSLMLAIDIIRNTSKEQLDEFKTRLNNLIESNITDEGMIINTEGTISPYISVALESARISENVLPRCIVMEISKGNINLKYVVGGKEISNTPISIEE